jgi:hypothetical protein
MASNYYHKFSAQELAEVYSTTMANYGKVEGELLQEINNRGGEIQLKQQISDAKKMAIERQRIAKEVGQLTNDAMDIGLIKKFIQSEFFSPADLEQEIDKAHYYIKQAQDNRKINAHVVAGCAVGIVAGTTLGCLLIYLQVLYFPLFIYPSLLVIYGMAYFIIRLITKRSAANLLVLISALIATILSPALLFYFFIG